MGIASSSSKVSNIPDKEDELSSSARISSSQLEEFIEVFREEALLPMETKYIQLRMILQDTRGLNILKRIAARNGFDQLVNCWTSIIAFRKYEPTSPDKHDAGHVIYKEFIEKPSVYQFFCECSSESIQVADNNIPDPSKGKYEAALGACREHFEDASQCCASTRAPGITDEATDAKNSIGASPRETHGSCSFPRNGFKWLQTIVFIGLYRCVSAALPDQESGGTMKKILGARKLRSKICGVDDFVYDQVIGEGSFGVVVLCRKKSTGKRYAMKVQVKDELVRTHEMDRRCTANEAKALSVCVHPFITSMFYAFQTTRLALVVTSYAAHGDLASFMKLHHLRSLPLDLIRFYMAELVSAVCFIHSKGMIHRDIKPGNILLQADGHIRLADFGTVHWDSVDDKQGPKLDESRMNVLRALGLTKDSNGESFHSSSHVRGGGAKKLQFPNDVVGTSSYMAPEICFIESLANAVRKYVTDNYFYSNSVDWWSVGATVYRLFVGVKPVDDEQMTSILADYDAFTGGVGEYLEHGLDVPPPNSVHKVEDYQIQCLSPSAAASKLTKNRYAKRKEFLNEVASVRRPVKLPYSVSDFPELEDMVLRLLDVNFLTRLNDNDIKKCPFFEPINWLMLDAKLSKPPIDIDSLMTSFPSTTLTMRLKRVFSGWMTADALDATIASDQSRESASRKMDVGGLFNCFKTKRSRKTRAVTYSPSKSDKELNMDFEIMLRSVGRGNWVDPQGLLNNSFSMGKSISFTSKSRLFSDWDFISYEAVLDGVRSDEEATGLGTVVVS